jgi:hypothetical protein
VTPEDTIVCLCTRQNFDKTHRQKLLDLCQRQQIQWDIVYATAEQHFVSPLVYVNLSNQPNGELGIPPDILNKFKKSCLRNAIVKRGTSKILEEILALFAQKGIDVMFVKGAALSLLVYEQPWYTITYDVDLVIRARRDEIDETDHREIVDVLEGFNHQRNQLKEHIEYDYYEHHDVTMNNVLAVDSERIWQESRQIQFKGYNVFVMTPEDMLIAAAINSCRKRFFRLKSLCDIVTIIDKYPDLDWEMLVSKAHAYECNTILYTALLVTQMTLGCRLPEEVITNLKVNPVRALIVSRLVKKLCQSFSLTDLFTRSKSTLLGREFSWPLLLTYATYRVDQLGSKMGEIYRAWRNPPPPIPG